MTRVNSELKISLHQNVAVATSIQEPVFDSDTIKQGLLQLLETDSLLNIGALVEFTGFVRADKVSEGKVPVDAIELEHYPAMTDKALNGLIQKALARFDCYALALVHRVGLIHVGEPIVYVAVLSSHRKESFACAQFLMDFLKSEIPLWKREQFAGGTRWVDQKTSDIAAQSRWD